MGIAMLVNNARFPAMIGQLAQDQGLIFLTGILSLLGGLAIVRVHNIWTRGWPVIITVLGWLAIVSGLVRMWFPHKAAPIAEIFAGNSTALMVGGVLGLVLGSFLTYKALTHERPRPTVSPAARKK
jgi:hypothetical protein